jgi:hypothetical protein
MCVRNEKYISTMVVPNGTNAPRSTQHEMYLIKEQVSNFNNIIKQSIIF